MKAIILAAGRGSRMKSLTDKKPKCLVELKGKPLLNWQVDALRAAGVRQIGIVTGYKREMLINKGLEEFHNPRWMDTQMVTSLFCAADWLEEEECIVSYSDIFYESTAVSALTNATSKISLTYDPNWLDLWAKRFDDPLVDAETFSVTPDSRLIEIGNKPESVDEINGQYMGLLKFSPEGWDEVCCIRNELGDQILDKMDMTSLLQNIIQRNVIEVKAIKNNSAWGEIDSKKDLSVFNDS